MIRGDKDTIHVLFCANPAYYQHTGVSACSLAVNNADSNICIHLITTARDGDFERDLHRAVSRHRNLTLEIYPADLSRIEKLSTRGHCSMETYLRFLATDLLPYDLSRVIYLDSDLLVLRSIRDLWRFDLSQKSLGAARDYPWDPDRSESLRHRKLGISPRKEYFNAGVLLIDLDRWRSADISEKLIEFCRIKGSDLAFLDQDALNVVLQDDVTLIDSRWNLQARMYRLNRRTDAALLSATASARRDPAILHFTTADKPWHPYSQAPRRSTYFRYQRLAGWPGVPHATFSGTERVASTMDRLLLRFGLDMYRLAYLATRIPVRATRAIGSVSALAAAPADPSRKSRR